MKNIWNVLSCLTLVLLFSLLNGCGGGGGGGAVSTPVSLKFRTYSASTVQQPGETQFRVLLPQGVSAATLASNPKVIAPGVVALSGIFTQTPFKNYTSGKWLMGSYSAAKPAGSGRDAIRVSFSLSSGTFSTGEFLTVNCSAALGSVTTRGAFTLDEVILGGAGGADLTGQYKLDFKVQ